MLFGHNTDVKVGDTVYHVQTEDRGVATAVIDTMVYCRGRVVHRCTTNYEDLLPWQPEGEPILRGRIDRQHNAVTEKVRNGEVVAAEANIPAKNDDAGLWVELLNAKEWLAGKGEHLQVVVREKHQGTAMAGARVTLRMDGATENSACSAQTGDDGTALLKWELPQIAVSEAAVILEASHGKAKGLLKFHLRTRTK